MSGIISLEERRNLLSNLKKSLERETKRAEIRDRLSLSFSDPEAERGKALISAGVRKIQQHASNDAAVEYLRATLAVIEGSTA